MDPLTAVGLASNILQFVSFASDLFSGTQKLYGSNAGATAEHVELESLTRNLRKLAENAKLPETYESIHLSKDEETLKNLSEQCMEVSNELLSVLDGLKVKGDDHRVWASFSQALKSIWKKEEIDSLRNRLDRIGAQLSAHILSRQQMQIFGKLHELAAENRRLQGGRAKDILDLKRSFEELFYQIKSNSHDKAPMPFPWSQLSASAEQGAQFYVEQLILESLHFDSIDDRQVAIRPPHTNTFSWIFQDGSVAVPESGSKVRFGDWLKSESNLFWISGKPGSGKSTLMKYLYSHRETGKCLDEWAQDYQLITASYFFWSAGRIAMQKSQEGLLRSVLYQILRKSPELIPHAYPDEWQSYVSNGIPRGDTSLNLTPSALLAAFKRIAINSSESKTKFCFFIDGLDEYEGKTSEIIHLLQILQTMPFLKICASSRPWNEFEEFFGQDPSNKFYMQDFTREDIKAYVWDTFEKNKNFQELKEGDDKCLDLVQDIVDTAKGVFLWVFLAVRSLLEGLTNADRIVDLKKRLRLLPTDLNEYFDRILFTVDGFYQEQMSQMFQVTLAARETLPVMCYWFIDQDDQQLVEKLEVQPARIQQITSRLRQMKKRLNACSKGLLEVNFLDASHDDSLSSSVLFNWKVDFLHRTVRDFLTTTEMQEKLHKWAQADFDADVAICRALLGQIKTAPQDMVYFKPGGPIWKLSRLFLSHIQQLEGVLALKTTEISLLEELNATLVTFDSSIGSVRDDIFSKLGQTSGHSTETTSLLAVAVGHNLFNYVSEKLNEQSSSTENLSTLLDIALRTEAGRTYQMRDFKMVSLLLEKGADLNKVLEGGTVWTLFLVHLFKTKVPEDNQRATSSEADYRILNALLSHGADVNTVCRFTLYATPHELNASQIFEKVLSREHANALLNIEGNKAKAPTLTVRNPKNLNSKKPRGASLLDRLSQGVLGWTG
ncbi:hypothetical protein EG329_011306 [Mollisiaceae sp. DMI_Dod_QoI]|nr:hypothetical protein EG329_011306 [Helotiales sp. DMI_Dod_QoI]